MEHHRDNPTTPQEANEPDNSHLPAPIQETESTEVSNPTPLEEPALPVTEEKTLETNSTETLQADERNFPKLPTSAQKHKPREDQPNSSQPPSNNDDTHFVWRKIPSAITKEPEMTRGGRDKGKGKQAIKTPESAPITRQGYRTGRLADDFWTALATPHTPGSSRKTLRVIPILIKDTKEEGMEYLVNNKPNAPKHITQVNIGELLAGLPWTETRTRHHVVDEVAQALYKVFVFPNPASNPLQRWKQGKWFAEWTSELEGDHACTLYVCVQVQESKLKPRKGHTHGWHTIPQDIKEQIHLHNTKAIAAIQEERTSWLRMVQMEASSSKPGSEATTTHQNRFAVLSDENTNPV